MSQLNLEKKSINQNYIHFLNESEIRYYFNLPDFTAEDRIYFFSISDTERDYFKSLLSDHSKLYYVLLSGYYKATNSVFTLSNIHVPNKDISYICEKYHLSVDKLSLGRNAISKHKNYMCKAYQFNIYTSASYCKTLIAQASLSAKIHIKPLYIFGELCRYLKDNLICMPSYREFQKIISKALSLEQYRLRRKLTKLPENIDKYLESIVQNTATLNLSNIIKQPQATTNQEINDELKRLASIEETYEYSIKFISGLSISNESVKHYSSLVAYYGRGRLARMQDPLVKLYIICYINHRFHKINDHLINSFRSITSKYYTEGCNTARESWVGAEEAYRQKRHDIANVLSMHYENQGLDNHKFSKVKQMSHKLVSVKDMKRAVTYMRQEDNRKNKLIWKSIGKSQSRYKKNIRKIFLHLDITSSDQHILKAIKFVKENINTKEPIEYRLYPKGIIPRHLRSILITRTKKKRQMKFAQYEFLVYWVLSEYLKDGDAYIKNSIEYKKYEDDLVNTTGLTTEDYHDLGIGLLTKDITTHLNALEKESEELIAAVNDDIALGINKFINIKNWHKREWTLPYIKSDIEVNNPFFDSIKQVNIVDVILFCNDKTDCLSAFTHLLPKNIKSKFSDNDAVACLIALGTNHGIHKMSKISNISYDTLDNSRKALFNIENIEECCNILSNSVEKLEAFEGYNINNYLHGGIDGQKHKTKYPVPSAVTSQKYYHLGPSFTANTLLVNHVPVNAIAFGSNNHESRYVFDLVYNNETDIQPEIISTDNAGVNAVNFALLDMLSKTFAPCFKQITNKDSMIVGFNKPASYKDYFLRPSRQAKKQLIIDEWDGIKKIGASLAMKKSSQSILIRKLCGTSRKNTTKEALWEYDAVIRSNYILKYIDDEKLRISVRTALNRNEAYHQLKRAISTVNSDSVLGNSDDNVMLNDQCSRLLSLMVIYYNGYLLSEIIKIKKNAGITDELKYYKHISLVAWTHINFHGYYNFERQVTKEGIEHMIEEIASLSPVVTG